MRICRKPRLRVEVIVRPPFEARHGVEVGDVYDILEARGLA